MALFTRVCGVLFCVVVITFCSVGTVSAASIGFTTPLTVSGTNDVLNVGTALAAYDWSTTGGTTVNGVAFTSTTGTVGAIGTYFGLTSFGASNGNAFTQTGAGGFTSLPQVYQNILVGAVYNGGSVTSTVTLNSLTPGHNYALQVWVGDPRAAFGTRTETITGANSQLLKFNSTGGSGGLGSYSTGFVTSDSSGSAAFTLFGTSGGVTQINAMQLRDVTNIGYWTGTDANGSSWDPSTTNNFATNVYNAALSTTTFNTAAATLKNTTFADYYWSSSGTTAVTNSNLTIASGGVSTGSVFFQNKAVPYTVTSSDSVGITGSTAVFVLGGGNVTLLGQHSYTGGTTIGSGGTLSVGNGTTDGALALATITNNGKLVYNIGGNQTFFANISGTGSLTKSGTGMLTLTAPNGYSGGTVVNGGTLAANGSGVTGAVGNGSVTVNNGGVITTTGDNGFVGSVSSGTKSVQINSGGLVIQTNSNTNHLNALVLNGGTLAAAFSNSTSGNWNLDQGVSTPNNGTTSYITGGNLALTQVGGTVFNIGATDTVLLSADIQRMNSTAVGDTGLIKTGLGLLNLSSLSNTYTSTTTVHQGTLQVGVAGAIPYGSGRGNVVFDTAANAAVLDINGFDTTVSGLTGITASTTNKVVNNSSGTNTLTVGNNNASSTFAGILADNNNAGTGVLALYKTGTGALTLNGANTYTGATTLAGGTLMMNGVHSTTSISVAAATTLGGSGSANSATATVSDGGILSPGYSSSGSLSLGGLIFQGGGTVAVSNWANYSSTPALNAGALTTAFSPIAINIGGTFQPMGSGTAHLIGYTGTIGGGGFSSFTIGTPTPVGHLSFNLVDNSAAHLVDFTYTNDTPYWTGSSDSSWTVADKSPNYNWNLTVAGTGTNYIAGDNVVFDNHATNTTVSIDDATVSPSSVTVNNDASHNYTFTGAGAIAGSTGLSKSGAGTLDISALTNSYSGATSILGGTIIVGSDVNLGFAPTSATAGKIVISGGTLSANNTFTLSSNRGIALGATGVSASGAIDVVSGGTLTYGGIVANASGGTGSLIKTGNGMLTLAGADTYTGGTTVSGGILTFGSTGSAISSNSLTVAAGAMVIAASGASSNNSLPRNSGVAWSVSGAISQPGGAAQTLPATITLSGGTLTSPANTPNASFGDFYAGTNPVTITANGSGNVINCTNVGIGSGITLILATPLATDTLTCPTGFGQNASSGVAGALTKTGLGAVLLSGTNAYTGGTTISGGTLQVGIGGTTGALGTSGSMGDNATLAFNRSDTITQGAQFTSSAISGTGTVVQMGPGTLILTASNTYSGATSVAAGSLLLNGGTLNTLSQVTLANGTTFGGKGSAGTATLLSGGTVQGGFSNAGKLALNQLTFNSSAGLIIAGSLAGYTASPAVAVSGLLNTSGVETINLIGSLTGTSTGTPYQLLTYGSIGGNGTGAFQLGTLPSRAAGSLSYASTAVNLTLTSTGDYVFWTGTNNLANGWDTTTPNWALNSTSASTTYIDSPGDTVVFDDRAAASNGTVNLAGIVHPSNVTFSNTATGYLLQGAGGIAGPTGLTVNGAGAVTIATSNGYTGGTTLVKGRLNMANSAAFGTGPLAISGGTLDNTSGSSVTLPGTFTQSWSGNFTYGGSNPLIFSAGGVALSGSPTLTVNGTGAFYIGGSISGTLQALTKAGPGTLTLGGGNSYSGGMTLAAGQLNLANVGALGTGTLRITGGTMDATSNLTLLTNISQSWSGNWTFGGSNPLNLGTGAVTLTNSPTVTVSGSTLTIGGTISGTGQSLTKAGPGMLYLTGATSYTGSTIVTGGTLTRDTTLLSQPAVGVNSIAPGATLNLYNTDNSQVDPSSGLCKSSTFSGGGTIAKTGAGYFDFWDQGSGIKVGIKNFTGAVQILQGTLASNNTDWASSGGSMSLFVASGANFDLRVGNVVVDALSGSGTIGTTNNIAPSLTAGNQGGSSTFSGVIENGLVSFSGKTNYNAGGILSFNKSGTGSLVLTGANIYTGGTTIAGGTLQVGAGGTSGSLPASGSLVDNGTLAFNRSDSVVQGTNFTSAAITGSGGLTQAGGGLLILNAPNSYTGPTVIASGTLQIGNGAGSGSLSSSSSITNNGVLAFNRSGTVVQGTNFGSSPIIGGGGLWQMGPGAVVLGTNSYTGATTVNAGNLYLNGPNATTSISVADGATLGGSGSASSAIATLGVFSGATLEAGYNGLGQLTLGGLTFASGGTINVSNPANYFSTPAITVTGAVTTNQPIQVVVNTGVLSGSHTSHLLKYGSIGGSGYNFNLAAPANTLRATYNLANNAPYVDFVYVVDYPYWTGGGDQTWNLSSTNNWKTNSNNTATLFLAGDNVAFDDRAGSGPHTVTIDAADVLPSTVTFSNTTASYTLQGSFAIAGGASLLVNGAGAVTINNANTYAGGTTLSSGVLNLEAIGAIGSGVLMQNGGTLNFDAAQSPSSINLNGGVLNLNNASVINFTPFTQSGGTLNGNSVQSPGSVTLSGGLMNLTNAGAIGSGMVTLSGGTLTNTSGFAMTLGNSMTLGGMPTIFANDADITLSGNISGGGFGLAKAGSSQLLLTGTNSFNGGSFVNGGTLQVVNGAIGNGNYAIAGGARFYANYATAVSSWTNQFTGAGTLELNTAQGANGTTAYWGAGPALMPGFTGTVQLDVGRLDVPAPANLGGASNIIVNNGGQLLVFSGTYSQAISIAGNGWGDAGDPGALRLAGATTGTWTGPITLTANAGIMAQGGVGSGTALFTLTGPISGSYQAEFETAPIFFPGSSIVLAPAAPAQNSYGSMQIDANVNVVAGNAYAFSTGGVVMNGGSLSLNGNSFVFNSLTGSSGQIQNSGTAAATITVGASNTNTSYSGNLVDGGSQSLALVKTGGATFVLIGSNGYSGGTTIDNGILQLGNSASMGTGGLAANGGTLDLEGHSVTVRSLSGTLGTVTDYGIGGGTTALAVNQTIITTFGGTIADGPSKLLALSLTNSGMLTLSGTNTYTGGTTVNGGTLTITNAAALADGSSLTVGSAFGPAAVVPSPTVAAAPVSPVPEPGTLVLMAISLLAVFGIKNLRRK
jgi:autotransporter-associated beta strand protein